MKVALYRKYRPTTFDGIIGQDVIVTTLTNQVKQNAVSHAYLFTGSRGTGKTSCAKIFARAVNCKSPINGSPCGKCSACLALATSTNLDVLEIDAASNNGVDNIRELRESVGYLPTAGKYKVYIIDEVYMLSGSAFNALLKTLEEPPAHVVFIPCTTEAHKLPATILSRCMRLDFNLVPTDELFGLVKKIFALEGAEADDSAIMHIAKLGEGSVRDTLSVADRCLAVTHNLNYETALKITGAGGSEETAGLMEAVVRGDAGNIISRVENLSYAGRSVTQISHELTVFARDLMLVLTSTTPPNVSDDMLARLKSIASQTSLGFLITLVRALGSAEAELRYSTSPRIVLESALLSLCVPTAVPTPTPAPQTVKKQTAPTPQSAPDYSGAFTRAEPKPEPALTRDGNAVAVLGLIKNQLRKVNTSLLYNEYCKLPDENVRISGNKFIVFATSASYLTFVQPDNYKQVQSILDQSEKKYTLTVERLSNTGKSVLSQIMEALGGGIDIIIK